MDPKRKCIDCEHFKNGYCCFNPTWVKVDDPEDHFCGNWDWAKEPLCYGYGWTLDGEVEDYQVDAVIESRICPESGEVELHILVAKEDLKKAYSIVDASMKHGYVARPGILEKR